MLGELQTWSPIQSVLQELNPFREDADKLFERFFGKDSFELDIPMLPAVGGERSAKVQSTIYAALTLMVSVIPFFTGLAGPVYLSGAVVLGVGLVGITVLDLEGRRWTRRVFTYSLAYVGLLFVLFAVSPFLP